MSEFRADPNPELRPPVNAPIVWTGGDLRPSDLPRWITITPTEIVLGERPDTRPEPSTCEPWAYPAESPPS